MFLIASRFPTPPLACMFFILRATVKQVDYWIKFSEFNPIHNEDLDSTLKNDRFDTESYLLESLLNHDALIASSLKIDSLLVEFASELIFLKSIQLELMKPTAIPRKSFILLRDCCMIIYLLVHRKNLFLKILMLKLNLSLPSPIPVEDSDSFMEEIDLSFNPDDPMPPSIEEDDYDSKWDILIFEELLDNYSLLLLEIKTYHFLYSFVLSSSCKTTICIPENVKTLAKGFYPPSLHFLSFNWESRDTFFLERLLHDDPIPLSDTLDFDFSNVYPPTDRSDFTHEKFVDELAHIISPPEYDRFYFWNLPDLERERVGSAGGGGAPPAAAEKLFRRAFPANLKTSPTTRSIRSTVPPSLTRRRASITPPQPPPPSPLLPHHLHTTTAIIYTTTEPTPATAAATPLHPQTTATAVHH
uniref:Uncharacterized protein n=1 Tax=Tanacetum cinerariifolium TaxID=118510 RepID=A0A6L2K891_TANCI|nr:hypothetical protein [Tanacetum cinerariifolium]